MSNSRLGLDALIPSTIKKDEKPKGKKDAAAKIRKEEEEEAKRFLTSQREALIICLEIAAQRYKTPWLKFYVICYRTFSIFYVYNFVIDCVLFLTF